MPLVYKDGQQIWVDDNDLTDTLGSGQWYDGFADGKAQIYVRNQDNARQAIPFTPTSINEYLSKGWRWETARETDIQSLREKYEESPGLYQPLAAGKGLASGATLGLSNVGLSALDIASSEQQEALHEAYPITENVSEVAGMVGTAVASGGTGLLAKTAKLLPTGILESQATKIISKLTAKQLAAREAADLAATKFAEKATAQAFKLGIEAPESVSMLQKAAYTAGKVLTGAAEGAAGNAVYDLASQFVDDEPFNAERLAFSAGLGAGIGGLLRGGLDILGGLKNTAKTIGREHLASNKSLVDFVATNLDDPKSIVGKELKTNTTLKDLDDSIAGYTRKHPDETLNSQELAKKLIQELPKEDVDALRIVMNQESGVFDSVSGKFYKEGVGEYTQAEQRFFDEYAKALKSTKPGLWDWLLAGLTGQRADNLAWWDKFAKRSAQVAAQVSGESQDNARLLMREMMSHPGMATDYLVNEVKQIEQALTEERLKFLHPDDTFLTPEQKKLYATVLQRLERDVVSAGGQMTSAGVHPEGVIKFPTTATFKQLSQGSPELTRAIREYFNDSAIISKIKGENLKVGLRDQLGKEGFFGKPTQFGSWHDELLNIVSLTNNMDSILQAPGSRPDVNAGRFLRSFAAWSGIGWVTGGPIGAAIGVGFDALVGDKLFTPLNALRIKNAFDKDLGSLYFVRRLGDWANKALGFTARAAKPTILDPIADHYSSTDEAYDELKTHVSSMSNASDKIADAIRSHLGPFARGLDTVALNAGLVAANAIKYLNDTMPKSISGGTLDDLTGHESYVSPVEKIKWLHRVGVVSNPEVAISHVENGIIRSEEIETLQVVYPSHWQKMVAALMKAVVENPRNHQARIKLSLLTKDYQGNAGLPLSTEKNEPPKPRSGSRIKLDVSGMQSGVEAAERHLNKI